MSDAEFASYVRRVQKNREKSLAARDVSALIGECKHPRRVQQCRRDLVRFCRAYLPHVFSRPFSQAHISALETIQNAILTHSVWPALFLPRGFGKSAMMQAAALWALIYGHCKFVYVLGASLGRAEDLMRGVVIELASNNELADDFPQVCVPIREIQGSRQRALNQNIKGELTRIEISQERAILPWVKSSSGKPLPFAGSIIRAAGLGAAIRGARHTMADGTVIRPDLVLIDDPQTDESARSAQQVFKLTSLLQQSISGLAAPGSNLTVILAATVIAPDDLAERIISRQVSMQFSPVRFSFVSKLPPENLLEQYRTVRAEAIASGNLEVANEWWKEHQQELENDIECLWPDYKRGGDVSAIQSVVHVYLDDPVAFACEVQNDPELLRKHLRDRYAEEVQTQHLLNCIVPLDHGIPNLDHPFIHAHIDVHESLLYYCVMSVGRDSAHILDYGTFPEQPGEFQHHEPRVSIKKVFGDDQVAIAKALAALLEELRLRSYANRHIDAVSVDVAWGATALMLRQTLASARYVGWAFAANGIARRPTQTQISDWKVRPGELHGPGYRFGKDQYGPKFTYDTNFFKSQVAALIQAQKLTIFQGSLEQHKLLFTHFQSETPVITTFNGRQYIEWLLKEQAQNHLWDCAVGTWAFSRTRFPQAYAPIPENQQKTSSQEPKNTPVLSPEPSLQKQNPPTQGRKKARFRPLFSVG